MLSEDIELVDSVMSKGSVWSHKRHAWNNIKRSISGINKKLILHDEMLKELIDSLKGAVNIAVQYGGLSRNDVIRNFKKHQHAKLIGKATGKRIEEVLNGDEL